MAMKRQLLSLDVRQSAIATTGTPGRHLRPRSPIDRKRLTITL
jgi:hypothetical protein